MARLIKKKNKTPERPVQTREKQMIGFKQDQTDQGNFLFLNFTQFADHIAWRVAHFIDDEKQGRNQSFQAFKDYMQKTGINVSVIDVPKTDGYVTSKETRPALIFSDTVSMGFALRDTQICDEIAYEKLKDHFGIDGENPDQASIQRTNIVPLQATPQEPTWGFQNDGAARERLNKTITAAQSERGIYGTFRPDGLEPSADPYQAALGMKMISRVRQNGKFKDVPYSKTYRPLQGREGSYSVETNSNASLMKFGTFAASSLEGFVHGIYDDGHFTIHGKSVFADRKFYGRRTKNSKPVKYKLGGDNGYLSYLPKDVQEAFNNEYVPKKYGPDASSQKNLMNQVSFTSVEMGNILPQQRRVFGIDVDNLKAPSEIDFINNRQESIAWLRERMPEAMQDAKLVVMLSSSYGMAKDSGTATFIGKSDTVSLRVWIEADQNMDVDEFKGLLRHHYDELAADTALFSHNQPIYGAPKFEGCEDPIKDDRFIVVPGEETFDVEMLKEEVADLDEQKGIDPAHVAYTGGSLAPSVRVAVNPMDGPIEQSRDRTQAKMKVLGNREAMEDLTGSRDHFGAVRQAINAHLNSVFDLYPASKPIMQSDMFQDNRDDPLSEEVRFLNQSITEGFFNAVNDSNKETPVSALAEYGIGQDGLILNGKIAKVLEDTCQYIATDREQKYKKDLGQILRSAKENAPLDRSVMDSYLSGYTLPTSINKSQHTLHADVFTGNRVLVNPEGLYIDDGTLREDHKIATLSGENRFFWAPVAESHAAPKKEDWTQKALDDVYQSLEVGGPKNMVFCHNCQLDDVRDLLPKPPAPRKKKLNIGKHLEKTPKKAVAQSREKTGYLKKLKPKIKLSI